LARNPKIENLGVYSLPALFNDGLKKLATLKLDLSETSITDNGIMELAANLNSQLLENLTLELRDCPQITDASLGVLSFGNLPSLKLLTLDLQQCSRITEAGIKAFSEGISGKHQSLISLKMMFSGARINDAGLDILSACISQNFQAIKWLSLTFRDCGNITDEGILAVINNFSHGLNSLQKLSFNVPE